jgi:hypothetical protein
MTRTRKDLYEVPDKPTPKKARTPRKRLMTYGQKKIARAALKIGRAFADRGQNAENTPASDESSYPSFSHEEFEECHMSWRTGIAVLALALVFGTTTYAINPSQFCNFQHGPDLSQRSQKCQLDC